MPYSDIWVNTSFGETHLIETGNLSGEPLLVFHGGNATTAYNLLFCDFLMEDFWLNRKVCDFSIVEFHLDVIFHPAVETWPILTQNSPHQRRNLIKLKHKNSFTKEILHTLRNLFSRTTKNKIIIVIFTKNIIHI